MPINEQFEFQKKMLLESYDLLSKLDFICNKDSIPENKKNLEAKQFIISICGAIKTGKSTLINYLFFEGKKILPTDVTPETAKLAKITKGPANKAVIHFLSKQKWNEYYNSLSNEDKEEVDSKISRIGLLTGFIKDPAYDLEIDDLQKIPEYLSKESNFAPLVESADIYIDHKILNNIVIVDTPGLNDPCKARSDITRDWVNKTDALIYLLNTKQALTEQDLNFIDEYCSSIDPSKMILVLSKIDLADYKNVQHYVENILKSDEFKDRLYLKDQKISYISLMAAMLKTCPDNVQNKEFYLNKIKRNPELIEKEGYLPELNKTISDKLLHSKGNDIISSHQKKIFGMLNKTSETLLLEIDKCIDQLGNYGKSKEEIEAKKTQKEILSRKINSQKEDLERVFKEVVKDLHNTLTDGIAKGNEEIYKEYKMHCQINDNKEKFKTYVYNTPAFIRQKIKDLISEILYGNILQDFQNEVNDILQNVDSNIKNQMKEMDINFRSFKRPIFNLSEVFAQVDEAINSTLSSEVLLDLRITLMHIFTKNPESINKLFHEVENKLTDILNECEQTIFSQLADDIKNQAADYFRKIENILAIVQKNLDNLKTDKSEIEQDIHSLKEENKVIEDKLNQVKSLQNQISAKLSF